MDFKDYLILVHVDDFEECRKYFSKHYKYSDESTPDIHDGDILSVFVWKNKLDWCCDCRECFNGEDVAFRCSKTDGRYNHMKSLQQIYWKSLLRKMKLKKLI